MFLSQTGTCSVVLKFSGYASGVIVKDAAKTAFLSGHSCIIVERVS